MDVMRVWLRVRLGWLAYRLKVYWRLSKHTYARRSFRLLFVALYIGTFLIAIPLWRSRSAHAATIARRNEASANTSGSATSLAINKPAGVVSGDVLVAALVTDAGGAWTPPSGWTQIQTVTNTAVVTAWYLVAGGSEPSSYTWNWANSTQGAGGIVAYTGVNNTIPIDYVGSTNTGSSSSVVSNAAYTVHDDAMIIGVFGGRSNGTPANYTPPGTMTERVDASSGTNAGAIEMTEENVSTAGSYASKTAMCSRSESFGAFVFALRPTGQSTNMLLFWDGGAAPSGWTIISAYDTMFPRGEAIANEGAMGGASTVTPTTSSVTIGAATTTNSVVFGGGGSPSTHTHGTTSSVTVGSASTERAYRSLKLIRYNSGIPNAIPSGAIALFDSNPGVPSSGWTRQSAQDAKFIKVDSSVTTGGSDTHTHTLTNWNGGSLPSDASTSNINNLFTNPNVAAPPNHTHTAPPNTNTGTNGTDVCASAGTAVPACLPPYVEPLMAKADSDVPSIAVGMIAMFDADPGNGWIVRSASGQTFYQQFMRPEGTFNGTSQGVTSLTHANAFSTSGTNSGSGIASNCGCSGTGAAQGHAHNITAVFNSESTLPLYFNVVIAQKVSFTLNAYRWYVDSGVEDVTDPWSSQDIAQSTAITVTPVANDAPGSGRQLRLRLNMVVGGQNLSASYTQFKLQYRANTDASCTSNAPDWVDVGASGGGSIWRYASSSITDGATISTSRLSPTSSVLEQYIKSSASSPNNPNSASIGQTIEYDFHIENNGAASATQYSFRVIETDNYILGAYSVCPTLQTLPGVGDQLRHGDVFVGGSDRGFTWAD